MKGNSANEFLDGLSYGSEKEFLFHGRKLFAQGYRNEDGTWTLCIDQWEPWKGDGPIWECTRKTQGEAMEAFLAEPLFDGKTFWEAETDIEVLCG